MRSQIILQNSTQGFLTMEVMLSFSLMILFMISTFTLYSSMQELKMWSVKALNQLKDNVTNIESSNIVSMYGNDTKISSEGYLSVAHSDYENAWGRNSCEPRLFIDEDYEYFSGGVDIGTGNISTDLEVRNDIAYLVADSTASSQQDFFIIDFTDFNNPIIISSLNTGPGISAVEVAGPYIFVAQSSTVNQLQIIDISNRNSPSLISQIKLPLPTATTTAPFATSIFYRKGFVYLGTTKWGGAEFSIIDVSNIYNPVVVGVFETGTLINDIYINNDIAYIASSDKNQMRVVDISNKSNPTLLDIFSPSGWQTQEGKVLDYFEGRLGLGRTVGGFNVTTNHEAFIFDTDPNLQNSISKDVPRGIYSMLIRNDNVFLLTHDNYHELQVWNGDLSQKIQEIDLLSSPKKMSCDGSSIYFSTGDFKAISVLKLNE